MADFGKQMTEEEKSLRRVLEQGPVVTSAPCRVDMGGTLDISTFYLPLRYLSPSTFNIAINLRTKVTLSAERGSAIRISSAGFEEMKTDIDNLSFDHPLGLVSAIAAYFHVSGIHIRIESASPPRSALGGSSAAAVALVGAYFELARRSGLKVFEQDDIPLLAHGLEQSVAGVPCGFQDHLAACYGGVNLWLWRGLPSEPPYTRRVISKDVHAINRHFIVAYCGIPHESREINSTWVKRFLEGRDKEKWAEIARSTAGFAESFSRRDFGRAAQLMNREVDIRLEMTPHVLDETGYKLLSSARDLGCGARFTGAGGGGCVWAVGDAGSISVLKKRWKEQINGIPGACLLDAEVATAGILCHS